MKKLFLTLGLLGCLMLPRWAFAGRGAFDARTGQQIVMEEMDAHNSTGDLFAYQRLTTLTPATSDYIFIDLSTCTVDMSAFISVSVSTLAYVNLTVFQTPTVHGPTGSKSSGTLIASYKNNFKSSAVSLAAIYTPVSGNMDSAGTSKDSVMTHNETVSFPTKIIFAKGYSYIVRTYNSGGSADVQLKIYWYETR